jgi:hypothetical protein
VNEPHARFVVSTSLVWTIGRSWQALEVGYHSYFLSYDVECNISSSRPLK